jgi:hypothetical protein
MTLRYWRKLQSCSLPGNRRRQQLLHKKNLTEKQKLKFGRNNQFFSTELRRRFSLFIIYNQKLQKESGNTRIIHQNFRVFRSFLSSSLVFFKNPVLIPGTLKTKNCKSLFLRQALTTPALNIWLNKVSQKWLYKAYKESLACSDYSSLTLIKNIESNYNFFLLKLGWCDSIQNSTKGTFLNQTTIQKKHSFKKGITPGEMLLMQNSPFLKNFKPFYFQSLKK